MRSFYTALANELRNTMKAWINQGEDNPAQGGWICEVCNSVGKWDETLQEIAKRDPKNILVRRAREGKTTSMKNMKGGDEVDAAAVDPPTPGTTHKCYYNAPSREHCWKCSRKPLDYSPSNGRKIAYMCKACNSPRMNARR